VLFGSSGTLGPLWTMQWEMLFSLLLPLFVLVAVPLPLWLLLSGSVALSVIAMLVSGTTSGSAALGLAIYMPMFMLGVALAVHDVESSQRRLWGGWSERRRRVTGTMLVGLTLLLLSAKWFVLVGIPLDPAWSLAIDLALVLPGVVLLLVLVRQVSWLAALMNSAVGQWLGRVSFSLYLTHVPLWIATIAILGQSVASAVVAMVVALAGSYLFSVLIELRAHRWARALYRRGVPTPSEATPA
jgi:peptidoglycan/LPS O-acetylase OafA/YrhL